MSTPLPPATPGSIGIASFSQASRQKRRWDAVLTCEDPRERHLLRVTDRHQLVLAFEDCDDISLGYAVATRDQIEQGIEFGRAHTAASLLIHCMHGVGRSAAIALAIIADRLGPGSEDEAVSTLLALRPEATPNLVAVDHADGILGRDCALFDALERSERADPAKLLARRNRAEFARNNPGLYAKA